MKGGTLHKHGATLVEQDGHIHRKSPPQPPGSPQTSPPDPTPIPTPPPRPEPSRRAKRGIDEEARRKAWAAIPEVEVEEGSLDRTPEIRVIDWESRPIKSISARWSGWKADHDVSFRLIGVGHLEGAIVRLYPPADVTPARIEEVTAECIKLGAVAVKVMPREQGDQVLRLDVTEPNASPRRSTREVLAFLVATLASPTDREVLWKVVEQAIEEGERAVPPKIDASQGEAIWIERIVLRNWFRYRGEHVIDLKPTVYGITATSEGDPERSNWQGKSSLLNAIAFGLFGWLPECVRGADDWITRGEDSGGVQVRLSNGVTIDRGRKRGKSSQLALGVPPFPSSYPRPFVTMANQGEAQKQIVSLLGLSEEDFFATSFFPQKEIARLVKAKPGERLEIVRGWLDLEALGAAEEWSRGKLEEAVEKDRRKMKDLAGWEDQIEIRRRDAGVPEKLTDRSVNFQWLEETANAMTFAMTQAQERAREAEKKIAGLDGWERDEQVWKQVKPLLDRQAELHRQRKAISIRVEGAILDLPKLKQQVETSGMEYLKAQEQVQQKKLLARGQFDGACPVAGILCPARKEIASNLDRNRGLLQEAEIAKTKALREYDARRIEFRAREETIDQAEQLDRQLAECSAKLEGMKGSIARIEKDGHPPDRSGLPDPRPIWKEASDAEQKRRILEEARSGLQKAWAAIDAIKIERENLSREIQILREATVILGKGGAQKVIAVCELARIEALANELLRQNGIDLSIAVKWGRESSTQLSPSCEKCGRSGIQGNGKNCPGCGSPRSSKVSEKLDVDLSDRSGAAEDLGGLALQIAASAWLRERRGARFGVVCIDEPFGALDPSHARSLSVHLAGILRGRSFKQGFVIAHSPSAMDALPGRIRVTGMGDGSSKVEVEG